MIICKYVDPDGLGTFYSTKNPKKEWTRWYEDFTPAEYRAYLERYDPKFQKPTGDLTPGGIYGGVKVPKWIKEKFGGKNENRN